jgi:hypothetical protein
LVHMLMSWMHSLRLEKLKTQYSRWVNGSNQDMARYSCYWLKLKSSYLFKCNYPTYILI